MEKLPIEIWLQILDEFDGVPPLSLSKSYDEPVTLFKATPDAPLKALSLTCRALRNLTLPLLFKHIQLMGCSVNATPVESYLIWLKGLQEQVTGVLSILLRLGHSIVESAYIRPSADTNVADSHGNDAAFRKAAAPTHAFWQSFLLSLIPRRLTLLAPPAHLAALVGAELNTEDAWAFDQPFQLLSVSLPLDTEIPTPSQATGILQMLPWTTLTVNEGSSIKAFSTYEYFHRRPPSMMQSLLEHRSPYASLREFHYIAIFPFSEHMVWLEQLPQFINLTEIEFQLAPTLRSGILDDKARLGKAQLSDCWFSIERAYRFLCVVASEMREEGLKVRRITTFDHVHPGFVDELTKEVMQSLGSGWNDAGDGMWVCEEMGEG